MNENYEIVFNNEFMKTIRLRYGVLVNIYKAKLGSNIGSYIENKRKDIKKLDERFYETTVVIHNKWDDVTYPSGSKLYKYNSCCYYVVEKLYEDKKDWYWEIETTGDYFRGNTEDFKEMIDIIKRIIEEE